jgi:hypothetical protein
MLQRVHKERDDVRRLLLERRIVAGPVAVQTVRFEPRARLDAMDRRGGSLQPILPRERDLT